MLLPLELIEEIEEIFLISHEEPVLAARTSGRTVFDKGAEWSHASAGTDHDDRCGIIGRQTEIFVRLHEYRHL